MTMQYSSISLNANRLQFYKDYDKKSILYYFSLCMSLDAMKTLVDPSLEADKTARAEIEYLKSKALVAFKKDGWKDVGESLISEAIEEARKNNIVIPLSEIDAIMEGRAPDTGVKATEKASDEKQNTPQEAIIPMIAKQGKNNALSLESFQNELKKLLPQIIQEIRTRLDFLKLLGQFAPELVKA